MQAYKATKEHPLLYGSVDILRLANPMQSYSCHPALYTGVSITTEQKQNGACPVGNWVGQNDSNLLTKRSRMKTTIPKRSKERECEHHMQSCDSEEDDCDASTSPETTPIEKRRRKVDRREIERTIFQESEPHDRNEGLKDFFNFRRFSARKRKQTDFLGVECDHVINGYDQKRQKREKGRRLLGWASRRLKFPLEPPVEEVTISRKENLRSVSGTISSLELKEERNDEDDEDKCAQEVCSADTTGDNQESTEPSVTETTNPAKPPLTVEAFELEFPIGSMVWGKLPGYNWWPGNIISYDVIGGLNDEQKEDKKEELASSSMHVWVKWYGETQLSKISAEKVDHFHKFQEFFQPLQMKGMYKRAMLASIKEAAQRCKMEFLSSPEDKKLRWVLSDQCQFPKLISDKEDLDQDEPDSPEEVSPTQETKMEIGEAVSISDESSSSVDKVSRPDFQSKVKTRGGRGKRGRGKGNKGVIRLTSLEQEMIEWACCGFQPSGPEGLLPVVEQQVQVRVIPLGGGVDDEKGVSAGGCGPDEEVPRRKQKVMLLHVRSKARFQSVNEGRAKLSDVCISCGDLNIVTDHPLFHGGLCLNCKCDFMETAYLFDEDGSQMYCTICSGGEHVFMCDAENCSKVYCALCVEKLCGLAELDRVKASEKWLCYMCSPDHDHVGLLEKREDWDTKLRELFMSDNEMEYDPPIFYPPLPPEERRPIRVLGLFDGIATGLVVLKELGLEVELYVASEIDIDAVYVSRVKHQEIIHVGDIERITEKEVKAWGPFDLVIGGSPCNDLSVVNPARRGIYEGTGRLFFEFYRILSYTRPAPGEERPFFWLFENVVSMKPPDKQAISRFLQCNPVVIDAREMSAAHRARYFWGNLPGMNRPTTPLPSDRLTLQSCLEPNCFRVAQFTKLRTITTKMNSIKQTKKAVLPVRVEGQDESDPGDLLWCTEMERYE